MTRPHVAHLSFITDPGVDRKLREQAEAARALGLPIDFYAISHQHQDHDEGALRFRRRRSPPPGGKMRALSSIIAAREDLIAPYVDPLEYDLFVIRFAKLFLAQGITYERYGSRIVTEHHSNEMAEYLLEPTLRRRFLAAVSLRRSRIGLAKVAGIIGVTRELVEMEALKAGRAEMPRFVFPNGVTVADGTVPARVYHRSEPLRIVFAAARYQPWQGLERLIAGLKTYTGAVPVHVRLAGHLSEDQVDAVRLLGECPNRKIEAVGLLDRDGLNAQYAWSHLGIAALSIYKNRMSEACPLKVREYAAQGLPFAYAFDDPDLPKDWPYALKLPADDSPVDFEDLVRFAEKLYGQGDPGPALHSYAGEHLDWKPKLARLYDFFCSLPPAPGPHQ